MLDPALKVLVGAQQGPHVLVTLQHCLHTQTTKTHVA